MTVLCRLFAFSRFLLLPSPVVAVRRVWVTCGRHLLPLVAQSCTHDTSSFILCEVENGIGVKLINLMRRHQGGQTVTAGLVLPRETTTAVRERLSNRPWID